MKCTNCGCKKLIKTWTPFGYDGTDGYSYRDKTLVIYSCFDCGHLEFFSTDAVDEYKENIARKSSILIELGNLRKDLNDLENNPTSLEIQNLEERLKSLDITVREQQELSNKLSNLRAKIRRLPDKTRPIKRQIKEFEEELKRLEDNISKVDIIDG